MKRLIKRFVRDESGTTAIEYAVIGTVISISIIAGATAIGQSSTVRMDQLANLM